MVVDVMRYDEYVKVLANQKDTFLLRHETIEQSSAIMIELFRHAKKELKLYDYTLDSSTVGKLPEDGLNQNPFSHVYNFLQDGKNLKILIKDQAEISSEIYFALKHYNSIFPKQIDIKIADTNNVPTDHYFAVNDAAGFRLELQAKHNANDIVKAAASFNDPVNSKRLNNAFDARFEHTSLKVEL